MRNPLLAAGFAATLAGTPATVDSGMLVFDERFAQELIAKGARLLSGQADRYNSGFFIKQKRN